MDEWRSLRSALPERYDTWTVVEDINQLVFEVEHGIKRWLALNWITKHKIIKRQGRVEYSYEEAPPAGNLEEVAEMDRWFRKRRKYRNQREFRFAWQVSSPELEDFPSVMDIELTKTGLALFKPWDPPME